MSVMVLFLKLITCPYRFCSSLPNITHSFEYHECITLIEQAFSLQNTEVDPSYYLSDEHGLIQKIRHKERVWEVI